MLGDRFCLRIRDQSSARKIEWLFILLGELRYCYIIPFILVVVRKDVLGSFISGGSDPSVHMPYSEPVDEASLSNIVDGCYRLFLHRTGASILLS